MIVMVWTWFYRGQKSYTSSGSFRQGYTLGDDEDDSTELITPIQKESDQGPQNQLEMRGTMVPPWTHWITNAVLNLPNLFHEVCFYVVKFIHQSFGANTFSILFHA